MGALRTTSRWLPARRTTMAAMKPSMSVFHVLALVWAAGCWAVPADAAEGAAPPPAAAASAPALAVPPLPLRVRTLSNGLQVIQVHQSDATSASVQVWYRSGSKDDPAGRSGFAHLFEHLMFKSTLHMSNEMFERLTEDIGGSNNAFTAPDTTAYHEVIPPNHVERLLWAEADRMANLRVDGANFDSERAVVKEEYRERVLASPYGRLFNAIPTYGYIAHPYRRPGIGSIEDLEASSLDDVQRFYRTYYRPDNAVLIVTGPTPPAQLDAWVDRYFGGIARPDTPVPRVSTREPRRTANEQVRLTGPNVPLPARALIWQGPSRASADAPALLVASALLSDGESSRLNASLVVRERLATQVGFEADLNADAGLLTAYAVGATGKPLDKVQAELLREIERLARGPVPTVELEKVRTRLLTGKLLERQTPMGQGMAIGEAVIWGGGYEAVNTDLQRLQAVTGSDVQRVLREYVVGKPRVTLDYRQAAASGAASAPRAASAPAVKEGR